VVGLSLLAHIPAILLGLLLVLLPPQHSLARKLAPLPFEVTIGFVKSFATFIAASIISGVVSIVVSQLAVMPLKPVSLRAAFGVVRERWRPFLKTGIRATLWIYLGFVVLVIPGVLMMTRYVLWAPVSLLERLEGRAALSRSRVLAARSPRTAFLTVLFQLGVTAAVPWAIGRLINAGASDSPRMADRFSAELSSLGSVLVMPLVSIVVALVYLKLRQLGGEAPVATETLPEVPAMADDPTRLFREEP
jgi:hypothetical protein